MSSPVKSVMQNYASSLCRSQEMTVRKASRARDEERGRDAKIGGRRQEPVSPHFHENRREEERKGERGERARRRDGSGVWGLGSGKSENTSSVRRPSKEQESGSGALRPSSSFRRSASTFLVKIRGRKSGKRRPPFAVLRKSRRAFQS